MKKTDYKNWAPKEMVVALTACTTLLLAGLLCVCALVPSTWPPRVPVMIVLTAALCVCFAYTGWSVTAYRAFSYGGKRQLSRQIIEGTAAHISLPAGGRGLDVGCGSGALTIACAKANPQGAMIGLDRWGKDYASFNKPLCEENAKAEGRCSEAGLSRRIFRCRDQQLCLSQHHRHRQAEASSGEPAGAEKGRLLCHSRSHVTPAIWGYGGLFGAAESRGIRAGRADRHHKGTVHERERGEAAHAPRFHAADR